MRLDRVEDGWYIVILVEVCDYDTNDLVFSGSFCDYLMKHVPFEGKVGRRI